MDQVRERLRRACGGPWAWRRMALLLWTKLLQGATRRRWVGPDELTDWADDTLEDIWPDLDDSV